MKRGGARFRLVLGCVTACFALGCGGGDESDGGDDGSNGPDCGTASSPDPFMIANVEPALGASVPNANIVHRFKLLDNVQLSSLDLALTVAHTAGTPMPNTTTWLPTPEADGVVYTSGAVSWGTAPGHVELQAVSLYDVEGCIYALPEPLFSYDVTAP